MASFRQEQIGINDAARLLEVKTSELRAAILAGAPLRGIAPPLPRHFGGDGRTGGWVFIAGDVLDAAESMRNTSQTMGIGVCRSDTVKNKKSAGLGSM